MMAVDLKSAEGQAIRKLIPIATLPVSHFEALCSELTVEAAEKGTILFSKGDSTREFFYLLNGRVTLQAQGLKIETIKADSEAAHFALAHQDPRKIDAIADDDIRYLRVNVELINNTSPVGFEEESSFMIIDESDENAADWMTALLKSPIFQRLPAANLQKILIELKHVPYKKGEVIVRQGESGDYYYLIKSGQCMLTRKPSPNAREIKLAQLRTNDTFGEDSLITETPRNVTVTALTDMKLLRIDKESFISLIKEPALALISYQELLRQIEAGIVLLDVRSPDIYEKGHLKSSVNVPFFSLRMQIKTLDRQKKYVVICENSKTSEAAAFLLIRNKIEAVILEGGMASVPPDAIFQQASFSIDDVDDGFDASAGESEMITENDAEEVPDVVLTDDSLNTQLNFLKTENESLRKSSQQLKEKCLQLQQDKQEVEKNFQVLIKQTRNLKEALDKLKAGK